ncbi:MAG: EamA family transporter [Streptosporangiales bacterium]|nr:EamA family transporter [Streptosporangiales bacterium]
MGNAVAPKSKGSTGTAVGLVLGGVFSLQFGAAFAALLFPRVGALGAVTLRLVIAAVLLLVVVRPRLRGHSRTDLAVVVGFGLILAVMNGCFYLALERLPLGVAVTFEFLGPLGLALVMSRRLLDLLWVGFAAGGVVLLGGGAPDGLDWVGVAFALAAATCWAMYILLSAETGRRFPRTDGLALAMGIGALAILPFGVVTAGSSMVEPVILGLGALVALMSSVVPYTLELLALRRIKPATFGILLSLEPAIAALAGAIVLTQWLSGWQLLAIGLVVVASAGATAQARKDATEPPEVAANKYLG